MDTLQNLISEARREFAAGNLAEAGLLCLAGLSEFPNSPALSTVLGWVYAQQNDLRSAEASFRHALASNTRSFDAQAGLAAVLAARKRPEEADEYFAAAIALYADDADTLFNHGCTLIALRRFDEAITRLNRAAQLDPKHVGAIHNLAIAHAQLGRWEAAVDFCNRALAIDANACHSQLLRGMARVALGSFAEGWDDYEARHRLENQDRQQLSLKAWDGELTGIHALAVLPEQGIGTQLMLASCLPELLQRVPSVTIGCDPRLVGLLKRSFPSVVVVAEGLLPTLIRSGRYDAYLMTGSLPHVLRRSAQSFPGEAYLIAEPPLEQHWRQRLAELGDGLKVGVTWSSAAGNADTLHRRTEPESWWPLATVPHVQWINLQCAATPQDLACWHQLAGSRFHDLAEFDKQHDLEKFAALVSQLDLVISVVNSTVHVAGGLGTPTWALVPAGGEWRWQARGERCVWHDSVRLFRQQQLGDWSDVFRRLCSELAALLKAGRNPKSQQAA